MRYAALEASIPRPLGQSAAADTDSCTSNKSWFRALFESLFRRGVESWLWPIPRPQQRLNAERRAALPESVRSLPQQTLTASHHSCGATHSLMERCNFACTSCYLSTEANAAAPLPWPQVKAQLDQLRAFLGEEGKAQLTSGEVTLLPVDVLGSYVEYARQIGLDPMVMTHGERLLEEPAYLRTLVQRYGLRKLSVHVDVTQRGRQGWRSGLQEHELHGLRDQYAQLLRQVRRETGARVKAGHTVTLNHDNLDGVPDIVRWVRDNADAFRIVSFQPAAPVGRTQDAPLQVSLDEVWRRVCDGLGRDLNRHAVYFGHPECSIVAPLTIVRSGEQALVIEMARADRRWDAGFVRRMLAGSAAWAPEALGKFFGLLGFGLGDDSLLGLSRRRWNPLAWLTLAARNLPLLVELPFYGLYRLWGERRALLRLTAQILRGRGLSVRAMAVVVHKFMSAEELATPLGQERLQACAFHLPVDGRMVPMCEVNATDLRQRLNRQLRRRPAQKQVESQAFEDT